MRYNIRHIPELMRAWQQADAGIKSKGTCADMQGEADADNPYKELSTEQEE
jgi:hypothetical protein